MSERDAPDGAAGAGDEPVLARWSRLKADARARAAQPAIAPAEPVREERPAPPTAAATAAEPPPPVQLPDIDQLGQDSDYSAFLTPGVDAELRKRALRKLFHSPKFNVFDGLDTYRDDFANFPALGDVVTADMRFQLERAAQELVARAEAAMAGDAPAAGPALIAPTEPVAAAIEHASPARHPTTAIAPAATDEATPARNEDDAEHGPA